jgi:predicted small lipoprotein YifL
MSDLRRSLLAAAVLAVAVSACGIRGPRQYEYEEQLYLFPDGSATVVMNASIPSLIALHGLDLDPNPRARLDRGAIRDMVSEPGLEISRVSRPWRRHGRQFVQIRAEIAQVEKLSETKLFGWSKYSASTTPDGAREYRQVVGTPRGSVVPNAGWQGTELVAFKLHLPSRIQSHNVRSLETGETGGPERGNILTWEQRLSDRLQGRPIDMQVTMDSGSILHRTLWIFALSFGAAVALLAFIVWRVVLRGRHRNAVRP